MSANLDRKKYQENEEAAYVMGYFTETPLNEGNEFALHLAYSYDGLNWIPLNNNHPVLVPTIGEKGLRDPFIYKKQDGSFIVLATNMWNSEYIMCYDSADLTTFENSRLLRLNTDGMHAWAPEVFFDKELGKYGIFWSGNTDRNRIYVNYTEDFVTISEPILYFDPGYNVIDAAIEEHDGKYYMYFKDERTPAEAPLSGKRMKGAYSSSLEPRSFDLNEYTQPIGEPMIEASIVIKKYGANKWFLYGDCYYPVNGRMFVWETDDLSRGNWTPLDRRDYNPPLNAKHGSVVRVTKSELERLLDYWGSKPLWNRIKSYSSPDCYVRHEQTFAQIAHYPFDSYKSSQWLIVPGLADPDGVSFESLQNRGHYLRNVSYALRLERNDGSDDFKNEATFLPVSGLSDSEWTSFQSFQYSDKFIKLDGIYLRVSDINNESDKQFATFNVCW
ncbi:glycoside hydrolase family 43 protein [Neobacillus cucumis]|uniref:AbfB domain-containing protein n=1 Tax=Neobacillus cucumis TaxID=1740721 RepID=UPI0020423D40|nr:AbfB domain-containing protein [Neobacillus cucumis]MCM3724885.1 glycoside hydrolase family 43 protein [Neobacillus cucumis]